MENILLKSCTKMATLSKLLLVWLVFFGGVVIAQTDSTKVVKDSTTTQKQEIEEDTTAKAWEVSINLGLNLSHTMQVNGVPNTGKLGFSTTNGIDLNVNYTKERNYFYQRVSLAVFAVQSRALKSITQKTADELLSLHDLSVGFCR
jgi:hypothetical protein